MANRRVTKLSTGEIIYTRLPNVVETQEADWEYSRVFNKAVEAGIPPRQVVLKRLMQQNIWTVSDEENLSDLRVTLDEIVTEAEGLLKQEPPDQSKIDELTKRAEVTRTALFAQQQKLNSLLSHTAETKAEDAKIYVLTSIITENKDGTRVWKTSEDFFKETDTERINSAVLQWMLLSAGLPGETEEAEGVKPDVATAK